jgi:hypothetical protein
MPRSQFVERISAVVDVEIEERADYEVTFAELDVPNAWSRPS